MEKEIFLSGYCRCLDNSRMVCAVLEAGEVTEIDCNMGEYEWSTLTIEVPAEYANLYLAKIRVGFSGNEIAIRAISIEN